MMHFTLDELVNFSRIEHEWVSDLLKNDSMLESKEMTLEPSRESINKILAFSKAYSVRKSKKIREYSFLIN